MSELLQRLRRNAGVLALLLNLGLASVLYFQYNPLNLIATGYQAADPLLEAYQEDVQTLRILDPDLGSDNVVALVRGEQLPPDQWKDPPPAEESAWQKFKRSVLKREHPEYAWQLVQQRAGGEVQFGADPDRIRDLFTALRDARRYYGVDRSPERDRDLEMGKDSRGRYANLRIETVSPSGEKHTLFIGRAAASGAESYVRLDEESVIFQVATNLRSVLGGGDMDYFRDRRVLPLEWKRESLTGLHLQVRGQSLALQFESGNWRLPASPGIKIKNEEVNLIAGDIFAWRAQSFPATAPADLDQRFAGVLRLELAAREAASTTPPQILEYQILGRRNFSSYVLRTAAGAMVEVNSIYLEDLYDPARKLVDTQAPAP
ncbi:MAG: DUF4340 domain-containing protein [Leptospirales bacterium]|nr:DUF4340 domain-containing protein [Leptospirales bacterium]